MTEPKIPITSLAGQTLGDESATDRERRLAGAILHQAREDQGAEAQAIPDTQSTPLEELELRKGERISLERLRQVLRYDPETGDFYAASARRKVKVGQKLGTKNDAGYIVIGIDKRVYKAHRLAWLLTYGTWPPIIDHANGDPSDNRLSNLRAATKGQNRANSKANTSSASGLKGVYPTRGGKWEATINCGGVRNRLGVFSDPEEAAATYAIAAVSAFGEFARGTVSDEPLDRLELRREQIQAKLSARRGRPGSAENVRDIETALTEINAEIDRKRSSDPEVA